MQEPAIGADVTALMPDVGDDVTALMGEGAPAGRPTPFSRMQPDESKDQYIERAIDEFGGMSLPGITSVASPAGPMRSWLSKLAPKLMRNALGAQQGIRNRFKDVNLDEVALREGAIPGNARSIQEIRRVAQAAGQAVPATAAAAGPQPVATAREVVRMGMRPMYDNAKLAQRGDVQQAILDRVRQIRTEYGEGLSTAGAQARKQILGQEAKSALRAPTPKEAGMGSQIANAERGAITRILRRNPAMESALDRSQEMMALERAMQQTGNRTSILRDALAAAAGSTAAVASGNPIAALITAPATVALNRTLTSPQVMGRAAHMMRRTGQTPATGELQSLLAQLLAGMQGQE